MLTLLIVDDNPADREGIRHLVPWDELGIRVIDSAMNGEEGLRKCMELQPDLVITDVSMPVMDGIQMAGAIRRALPNTGLLFMSCFDEFDYVRGALKNGAYGYVLKPINIEELMEAAGKAVSVIRHEQAQSNRIIELREQVEQSLPVLRERFMQELAIQPHLVDNDNLSDRLRFLGIPDGKMFTIVHIGLETSEEDREVSMDRLYMAGYSLKNGFEQSIAGRYDGYVIMQDLTTVRYMLFIDPWEEEDSVGPLLDLIGAFKEAVTTELGMPVFIVIGDFSTRLMEANHHYEQVLLAADSRYYSGANRIILVSEVKAKDAPPDYDFKTLKLRVSGLLDREESGSDDVDIFLNCYFSSEHRYPSYYYKGLSLAIVTTLQAQLLEKNESLLSVIEDVEGIWRSLEHMDNVDSIRSKLEETICSVCLHLSRAHSGGKYGKIVEDIKELVDRDYGNYTNIEQIVQPLYLSAAHANAIFKQQTGQTIFDYLIGKKIEVAKRMLLDPYIKVYEVAQHVGYRSKSYFSLVFKDYTGMSPRQYMDKQNKRGQ